MQKVYPEAAPAKEETKDYRLAADGKTLAEWRRLIEEEGAFAFKVLADGINPVFDRAVGVALSVGGGRAVYLPFAAEAEKAEAFDLFPRLKANGRKVCLPRPLLLFCNRCWLIRDC